MILFILFIKINIYIYTSFIILYNKIINKTLLLLNIKYYKNFIISNICIHLNNYVNITFLSDIIL